MFVVELCLEAKDALEGDERLEVDETCIFAVALPITFEGLVPFFFSLCFGFGATLSAAVELGEVP